MVISKKVILCLMMIMAISCQDFSSPAYLSLKSNEKMSKLWKEISNDQTSLPFYSALEIAKLFLSDLWVTFQAPGDVLPEGRKKLIHTTGSISTVNWISTNDHPYTGVFKGATDVLLRFSIAKKPDETKTTADGAYKNYAPGIAIKFLRDGVDSGNLVAMYSTRGQHSWNPFANDFTNSFFSEQPDLAEKALSTKFSCVTNNISSVGLKDMATYGQDGVMTTPRFPFKLIFRPSKNVSTRFKDTYQKFFTEQLAGINPKTIIYEVYAIDQPGCPETKIADIQLRSGFIKSHFGDEKLFFRHGLIDDDDKGTDWAQYRDYFSLWSGAVDAKVPEKKSGCPFAKLF